MEEEMKTCLNEVMCVQKKLLNAFTCALDKGIEQVNTQEAGEIADMIKDMAEAEEKCWKACYYKSIVEAMDEHKDTYGWYPTNIREWDTDIYGWYPPKSMYSEAYGYNNGPTHGGTPRPMRSDGSYGYRPSQPRDSQGQFVSDGGRMGYWDGMINHHMPMNGSETGYGRAYDKYQESRRHFTETGNTADREEMNQHAKEHLDATVATMGEIYKSSDPELKRQIKSNLGKLISDMG